MSDALRVIAYQAEMVLLELAELFQTGPVLRIVHRFWIPGTECLAGEEIWGIVLLVHGGREIPLPLSLALRQLVNYLAETRHIPQSAAQIAAGMCRSAFYAKHGMNSGIASGRRVTRSAVKEYVKRLRRALSLASREAGINLDPLRVLVSRQTVTNEVQYQLRATIQWVHISDSSSPLSS